jgi:serine/threonine protein kinase/WD40 repeat protein
MTTDTSGSNRLPIDVLAEEFVARFRDGERPALSEYVRRAPELEQQIRALFPTLAALEQAKPSGNNLTAPYIVTTPEGLTLERLGDYRILREVGRGGMGVVYEAEQLSLGRRVALKVLQERRLDSRHLSRFEREAKAAARLHHTNIVPVYGVGEADGVHFYVMQFIAGMGLDAVLEELRRMRTPGAKHNEADSGVNRSSGSLLSDTGQEYYRTVAKLGERVAEALHYAHQQGILHRDIKPSNLLLDTQGTIWVTDFGLAKTADSEDLTSTGDMVGTLRYMAPERFHGRVDARSDVYSLGLTLYELLAQRPAFDAKSKPELLRQATQAEPPPLHKLVRGLPRDLETAIQKSIAREPAERYASAREMADDLRAVIEDRPIKARRSNALERFGRWSRRNPAIAGLLAAVLLTTTAGAIVATRFAFQAGHQEQLALNKAKDADDAARRERAEKEKARALLYAARIREAQRALRDFRPAVAREVLAELKPNAEQKDLRGFEWNYLERILNEARATKKYGAGSSFEQMLVRKAMSADGTRVALFQPFQELPRFGVGTPQRRTYGQAEIIDTRTGKRIWNRGNKDSEIVEFELSCDGRWLAMATKKPEVQIWDVDAGKMQFTIPLQQKPTGLVFDGEAKQLAVHFGPEDARTDAFDAQSDPIDPPGAVEVPASRVNIWNLDQRKCALVLNKVPGGFSRTMLFAPDGKSLLVGEKTKEAPRPIGAGVWSQTENLILWDLATNKPRWKLSTKFDLFAQVAFRPDGRQLAIGSGNKVSFVDADSGKTVGADLSFPYHVVTLAFSPDNRWLAVADAKACDIRLFSCDQRRQMRGLLNLNHTDEVPPQRILTGHEAVVIRLAFRPDGRRLYSLDVESTFKEWEIANSWSLVTTESWQGLRAHFADNALRIGKLARQGDNVMVWEVSRRKVLLRQKLPRQPREGPFDQMVLSPSGRRLAVFSLERPWESPDDRATALARAWFTPMDCPGGLMLGAWQMSQLIPHQSNAYIFDVDKNQKLFALKGENGPLRFSPDDRFLLTGNAFAPSENPSFGLGGGLKIQFPGERKGWTVRDATTGKVLLNDPESANALVASAFDGQGRLAVWTSRVGKQAELALWDLATGRRLWQFSLPEQKTVRPERLVFSPDGNVLAGVAYVMHKVKPGNVGLPPMEPALLFTWKLMKQGLPPVMQINGLDERCSLSSYEPLVEFSPDSRSMAFQNEKQHVVVWDLTSGRERFILRGLSRNSHMAFSPDGSRLLTTGQGGNRSPLANDMECRLWDMGNGQELLAVSLPDHFLLDRSSIRFDGQRIYLTTPQSDVEVLDGSPRGTK